MFIYERRTCIKYHYTPTRVQRMRTRASHEAPKKKKMQCRSAREENRRPTAARGLIFHISTRRMQIPAREHTAGVAGTILISKLTESDKVLCSLWLCMRCSLLSFSGSLRTLFPAFPSMRRKTADTWICIQIEQLRPNHRPFFTFACCLRAQCRSFKNFLMWQIVWNRV